MFRIRVQLLLFRIILLCSFSHCYIHVPLTFPFPVGFPELPEIRGLIHLQETAASTSPPRQDVRKASIRTGLNLSPCTSTSSCVHPRRCQSNLHTECDETSTSCVCIPSKGMVPCSSNEQCEGTEQCVYSMDYTPDPWCVALEIYYAWDTFEYVGQATTKAHPTIEPGLPSTSPKPGFKGTFELCRQINSLERRCFDRLQPCHKENINYRCMPSEFVRCVKEADCNPTETSLKSKKVPEFTCTSDIAIPLLNNVTLKKPPISISKPEFPHICGLHV